MEAAALDDPLRNLPTSQLLLPPQLRHDRIPTRGLQTVAKRLGGQEEAAHSTISGSMRGRLSKKKLARSMSGEGVPDQIIVYCIYVYMCRYYKFPSRQNIVRLNSMLASLLPHSAHCAVLLVSIAIQYGFMLCF